MNRENTSTSTLAREEACPGSAFANLGRAEAESEEAKEGTMLHLLDSDPTRDRSHLNEEQIEVLKSAADADEKIFAAIKSKMSISEDEPFLEGREQEKWFYKGLRKLFPGHVDRWRYYSDRRILIIIDKKFGRKEVTPADANIQLRGYAVQWWDSFDPVSCFVAINQPRLFGTDRITIGEYNATAIEAARKHILKIWDGSHNRDGSPRQDAPRIAGEDQCLYCKAKLDCDAYRAQYAFLAKPSDDGKDAFVAKISGLTTEQIDTCWRAVTFAKLIEKDLKKELIRRIDSGFVTNYAKQNTGSTTSITDEAEAIRLLFELGLPVKAVTQLATFKAINEAVAKLRSISMDAADKLVKETLSSVSEKKPKEPSLKRLGAPKPIKEQPALL